MIRTNRYNLKYEVSKVTDVQYKIHFYDKPHYIRSSKNILDFEGGPCLYINHPCDLCDDKVIISFEFDKDDYLINVKI
ncbi:MAG: hypothetical protein EOL97_16280 [Spirochaetia bacterium]|nr:hypothetical protein [Spirochaetia bacterium]